MNSNIINYSSNLQSSARDATKGTCANREREREVKEEDEERTEKLTAELHLLTLNSPSRLALWLCESHCSRG